MFISTFVRTSEVSNPFDLENIDSTELSEINLRRAVSALSFNNNPTSVDDSESKQHVVEQPTVDLSEADLLGSTNNNNNNADIADTATLSGVGRGRCEPITVPMCRNLAYNMTSMPNQFEHSTQSEAAAEAHQFWALVEFNCAPELKFFLCSMYTPICISG